MACWVTKQASTEDGIMQLASVLRAVELLGLRRVVLSRARELYGSLFNGAAS